MIATGVRADGHREILGLLLGDSESETSGGTLFRQLKGRGLRGVDLVVSDQHGGLVAAATTHFQGASWQRCQAHFSRNVISAAPKAVQKERGAHLRALLTAPDPATARRLLQETLTPFTPRAPQATAVLEVGFDDATAVLALPEPYRTRLRTTNSQERRWRGDPPPRTDHPHLSQPRGGPASARGAADGVGRAVEQWAPLPPDGCLLAVETTPAAPETPDRGCT